METRSAITRTELDRRSADGVDVSLVWITGSGVDRTVVCVRDRESGAEFEIATELHLALEVFEYPFAYAGLGAQAGREPLIAA